MTESHECTVHHNTVDLVVKITRADEDADWELDEVRVPSKVPNAPDSENIAGWIDRTCSIVNDELLELAIQDIAAVDEMHQIDRAEERDIFEMPA